MDFKRMLLILFFVGATLLFFKVECYSQTKNESYSLTKEYPPYSNIFYYNNSAYVYSYQVSSFYQGRYLDIQTHGDSIRLYKILYDSTFNIKRGVQLKQNNFEKDIFHYIDTCNFLSLLYVKNINKKFIKGKVLNVSNCFIESFDIDSIAIIKPGIKNNNNGERKIAVEVNVDKCVINMMSTQDGIADFSFPFIITNSSVIWCNIHHANFKKGYYFTGSNNSMFFNCEFKKYCYIELDEIDTLSNKIGISNRFEFNDCEFDDFLIKEKEGAKIHYSGCYFKERAIFEFFRDNGSDYFNGNIFDGKTYFCSSVDNLNDHDGRIPNSSIIKNREIYFNLNQFNNDISITNEIDSSYYYSGYDYKRKGNRYHSFYESYFKPDIEIKFIDISSFNYQALPPRFLATVLISFGWYSSERFYSYTNRYYDYFSYNQSVGKFQSIKDSIKYKTTLNAGIARSIEEKLDYQMERLNLFLYRDLFSKEANLFNKIGYLFSYLWQLILVTTVNYGYKGEGNFFLTLFIFTTLFAFVYRIKYFDWINTYLIDRDQSAAKVYNHGKFSLKTEFINIFKCYWFSLIIFISPKFPSNYFKFQIRLLTIIIIQWIIGSFCMVLFFIYIAIKYPFIKALLGI